MRLYEIIPSDVELTAAHPTRVGVDEHGNPRLTGICGRAIIVVVARDDPDFVITTFPDD